jgi:hypothetical protein
MIALASTCKYLFMLCIVFAIPVTPDGGLTSSEKATEINFHIHKQTYPKEIKNDQKHFRLMIALFLFNTSENDDDDFLR